MGKRVLSVFRILGFTLICFFLLDTGLVVYSMTNAYQKLQTVMDVAQQEVASHNCITAERGKELDNQLIEIAKTTPVTALITEIHRNFKVQGPSGNLTETRTESISLRPELAYVDRDRQNLDKATVRKNQNYTIRITEERVTNPTPNPDDTSGLVGEDHVGNYGDFKDIQMTLVAQPHKILFSQNTAGIDETGFGRNGALGVMFDSNERLKDWTAVNLTIKRTVPCLRYLK